LVLIRFIREDLWLNFTSRRQSKAVSPLRSATASIKELLEQVAELAGDIIHRTGGSISGGSCGTRAAPDKIIELAGDRRRKFVFEKIDYRADCGPCLILRDAGLLGYLFDEFFHDYSFNLLRSCQNRLR
jgi:hypothetical protein